MSSKTFVFFGFSTRPPEDGHKRMTRTKRGSVVGGSEEEHERLQEAAIKIEETADRLERRHGVPIEEIDFERVNDEIARALGR